MASNSNNVSFWLKFFLDAGIPAGEAANHAVTFTDHRIQTDMLLDLNKEYLNEMGISMMGDVIAILKHAKTVHSQTAREKALKTAPGPSGSPSPRRSTPASRIVDHYLRSANDPEARPMNERTTPKMSVELAARLGPSPAQKEPVTKTTKIQLLPTQKEEVPVPKARRVFPEHEGKYKVTMPKGSTARSKKILQKKGVLPAKSNTVFDRLGASLEAGDASSAAGFSVFNRLGGKSIKRPATSTSCDPDDSMEDDDEPGSPLAYAGVLKDSPAKKPKTSLDLKKVPSITISNTKTKSEDAVHSEGVLAVGASAEKKSALSRLGKPIVQAATSSTSTVTPKAVAKTGVKKTGLAARLGPQKMEVSSSEDAKPKGVFSRLGKPK